MERKEPTFSAMDSSHEAEQAPILSKPANQAAKKSARVSKPVSSESAKPAGLAVTDRRDSSSVPAIAMFLALAGLGLGLYLSWTLMQTQQQLETADSRILELQQALVLTGDESTQSLSALQANLRINQQELKNLASDLLKSNHEIRKLWDTRNVNKKAIAANKTAIGNNNKSVNASVAKIKPLAAGVKSAEDQLASQKKLLQTVKSDASQALEAATLLSGSLEQQQQRLRELVDAGNINQASLRDLSTKIEAYDEVIRSIDAFRKNTNNEIWKLKQAQNQGQSPRPAQ